MTANLKRNLPGQTPLEDCSGLKLPSVKTRAHLNRAEYENCAEATYKYLSRRPTRRMAPFTRPWMLRLHREMFGKVWKWAGKIRKSELNVGVPSYQVGTDLEELSRDVACWTLDNWSLIEQAATLHWRAVHIHPFLNGNGRWARLLANIWMRRNDGPVVAWPQTDLIKEASPVRSEYIAALKEADANDLGPLVKIHERYVEEKAGT